MIETKIIYIFKMMAIQKSWIMQVKLEEYQVLKIMLCVYLAIKSFTRKGIRIIQYVVESKVCGKNALIFIKLGYVKWYQVGI